MYTTLQDLIQLYNIVQHFTTPWPCTSLQKLPKLYQSQWDFTQFWTRGDLHNSTQLCTTFYILKDFLYCFRDYFKTWQNYKTLQHCTIFFKTLQDFTTLYNFSKSIKYTNSTQFYKINVTTLYTSLHNFYTTWHIFTQLYTYIQQIQTSINNYTQLFKTLQF